MNIIRIVAVGQTVIDLPMNFGAGKEGEEFATWCKRVKSDGGIFSEGCHIPYLHIVLMMRMDESGQPMMNINAQPPTSTKQ
jgi:hypothetical protein